MRETYPAVKDKALVQIVDAAFADAARQSGEWLLCRPGCTQCCIGVFPINQLDAARLRLGMTELQKKAPKRAELVRDRARKALLRLSNDFPGNPRTGVLDENDTRFAKFGNDEPCPALDPQTGTCELYEFRPMTCRVFGPPLRSEDGLGVCELCFKGAPDDVIAACEMKPDPEGLESALLEEIESCSEVRGNTIIAFCLGC